MIRRKIKKIILLSLFTLIAAFTFSCKKETPHVVKYTTLGSTKSTVTYTDKNGNVQTVTNADTNWSTSFSSTDHGLILKLTALSNEGIVIGKIFIDDNQVAQSTGNTNYITISATLP